MLAHERRGRGLRSKPQLKGAAQQTMATEVYCPAEVDNLLTLGWRIREMCGLPAVGRKDDAQRFMCSMFTEGMVAQMLALEPEQGPGGPRGPLNTSWHPSL